MIQLLVGRTNKLRILLALQLEVLEVGLLLLAKAWWWLVEILGKGLLKMTRIAWF